MIDQELPDDPTRAEPSDFHELALAVRDVRRMPEVGKLVVQELELDFTSARKLLCSSPTVLSQQLSADRAATLEQRFEALRVDAVVSRAGEALYDVFLGDCSPGDRPHAEQMLRDLGIELARDPDRRGGETPAALLVPAGLSRAAADRLEEGAARGRLPIRVINRDFERFELRLEQAPDTPEMVDFLTATSGMPEVAAREVGQRVPLITHRDLSFDQTVACLEEVQRLGGVATAELPAFRSFDLAITRVRDLNAAAHLIRLLTEVDTDSAAVMLQESRRVGPLTPPQARWLQWQLGRAGTESEMVQR